MDDMQEKRNIVEAALLAAGEPVAAGTLAKLFDPALDNGAVHELLDDLARSWTGKGVELVQVATGWRFQCKPAVQAYLDRLGPAGGDRATGGPGLRVRLDLGSHEFG